MNKPTFEDLIGTESVEEWTNDVTDGELSIVSSLANKQIQLARQVATLEEDLKAKKEELRLTSEQELPDAMQSAGLTQIISINEFYNAHISKANQETAYRWLIENGHEGLIKNEVLLKFGREESVVVEETVSALQSRGLSPEVRQSVHPSTLKAFVKEQFISGNDIPTEPFSIYIGTKATIKKD
mgnify:CR=1 FL=1